MFKHPEKVLETMFHRRTLKTITPGVLTVSAYANFYPVCYKSSTGKIEGLDVDIMVEFCRLTKMKLKIIEKSDFNGIWLDPVHGISDIAIGGIGISDKRTRVHTTWTIPYFYVKRTCVYNLDNPIKQFPRDVTGIIRGTQGSTGWLDGQLRMKNAKKTRLLKNGHTDHDDIQSLKYGKIQGLLRGSFVGKALVAAHPKEFGMVRPWDIDHSLVASDGEVFAYPCNIRSGVGVLLSALLTEDIMNSELGHLIKKYNLE